MVDIEKYKPEEIEHKWQDKWRAEKIYQPDLKHARHPFYNLMMFPYPSAEGLHVGNMYAFTGSDVYGRFKRMQGYDVFEPIGLDGFGIHSENYALKIGGHPMRVAERTQENFYTQLKMTGNAYAWDYTLETYSPWYYKWTQWLFLQFYKQGLAYRRAAPVNFCPSCKTVLADEQVEGGTCERCDTEVEERHLRQWFLKITDYAEQLLQNLEQLDWSERVKTAQRNWIGKSEGARVYFPIAKTDYLVETFTTRPDTLFGVTYLVLSPRHELIRDELVAVSDEAKEYVREARRGASSVTDEEKSGADTGLKAIHPGTGREIPVWVADYVVAEYGTGAVMGVPAHDERDYSFAHAHDLPVQRVIQHAEGKNQDDNEEHEENETEELPYTGEGTLVHSDTFDGTASTEARERITEWLTEEEAGETGVSYHLRDWLISRQRYWGAPIPVIYCATCWARTAQQVREEATEGVDYELIDGEAHAIVPVPEEELPVRLPYLEEFKPTGAGEAPLAQSRDFYRTVCPECKTPAVRETDVCDTFLDSCWYFLRYPSLQTDTTETPFDDFRTRKWLPVDMYIGGAEHAVLHLLYSRFTTMALHDMGHIPFEEPFITFRAHGLLISEGAKMSKSKGNVINPDEYIAAYGADTLRTYLLFTGDFREGGDFRDEGIVGIHRFLRRVWDLTLTFFEQDHVPRRPVADGEYSELDKEMHKTRKKAAEDIEHLKFNTAVAQLMTYQNTIVDNWSEVSEEHITTLLKCLAPFAPHLCEELWQRMKARQSTTFEVGPFESVSAEQWPEYDEEAIEGDTFTMIVQVNGKARDQMEAAAGIGEDEAVELAQSSEKVQKWLNGKEIEKTVFVPGKLVNFVLNQDE